MKKDSRKTPLTEEHLRESDCLRALYASKKSELGLTQDKIAADLGDGVSQGAVSHFMNRRLALNLKAATVFARHLQVPVAQFSPRLAAELELLTEGLSSGGSLAEDMQIHAGKEAAANTPFPAGGETATEEGDRYAFVPQYDAKAAAGLGSENPHVEIRSTLAFKREWLKVKGVKPDNLIVIYAEGHSMCPTIDDGDVLLVDRSRLDPADGQVFVLANGEGTIVKRLISIDDEWLIRSDNADKARYADRAFQPADENEHRIIGRVIWRGGDL